MKWREILEAAIIGKVVTTLTNAGYRLEIKTEGAFTDIRAVSDYSSEWVVLVEGNEAFVVADYSTNLEKLMAPINLFCARMDNGN